MQTLTVPTDAARDADVARALWPLLEARRRTLRAVRDDIDVE